MDKKLEKIYDLLTEEQKQRASECHTAEEFMEFAGEEGIELPEELLEMAAGGGFFDRVGDWFKTTFGKKSDSPSGIIPPDIV